jgi:hypothetical protein
MADGDPVRVDIRFKTNVAAVALAIDLHSNRLIVIT